MKTMDDWRHSLERNEIVGLVFSDLLSAAGESFLIWLQGDSLRWSRNYLYARKQRVVLGDETFEWIDVCAGVPLGCILGPLLFSIFVNDLPSALTRSKVMMYADDTTVYYSDLNNTKVQEVYTYGGITSFITMDLQKLLEN